MYENILSEFYCTYWAILPERLAEITAYLTARHNGDAISQAMLRMPTDERGYSQHGSVAVVPIHGTIYPRGGFAAQSGATTGEAITRSMRAAVENKDVSAIVLDINSPGGAVVGTAEAGEAIRNAGMVKPVHAVANHMAASGGYWLGSQATTLTVAPNGQVGSIGVILPHEDHSVLLEKEGIKITAVTSSPYKGEGAPWKPLSPEAIEERQRNVNEYHRQFVAAVAQGRRVSPEHVEMHFGKGRVVLPDAAKMAGMVDRVATLEEVVAMARENARLKDRMKARVALANVA